MLWNRLHDDAIDPARLISALSANGDQLILGTHNVYEFARCFKSETPSVKAKGNHLFAYISRYVALGIPCLKDNPSLLVAEMESLKSGQPVDSFYGGEDRRTIQREIESLAKNGLSDLADEFIAERTGSSAVTRSDQIAHFKSNLNTKDELSAIDSVGLSRWLHNQVYSRTGFVLLTQHIGRNFPEVPTIELMEWSAALLRSQHCAIAKGFVRADLYYNWRCAQYGSNSKDLLDDMCHVLAATHCNIYATQENKQGAYANLLAPDETQLAIYDGEVQLEAWLPTLSS